MSSKLHKRITDQVLADLRNGCAPWLKPWRSSKTGAAFDGGLPYNGKSRRNYSGVNILLLWGTQSAMGYSSNAWLTYKQAVELGGHVRKGEKATQIVFLGTGKSKTETDAKGNPKTFSFLKFYNVFNLEQCEGVTLPEARKLPETIEERLAHAEEYISATDADIRPGGDRAFYTMQGDYIGLPAFASFDTPEHYYATALHELTHWTGHPSRNDRSLGNPFGSKEYAFEELIAELGAAFQCAALGIKGDLRHSGYIGSWITLLEDNERALVSAAAQASKAVAFIEGFQEGAEQADQAA